MKNKTLGIIVEYNPFHNGHLYNINKSKEISKSDDVVVVMSGNYVQRGLPAICDKYERCKMALSSGVDLCIEMPTHFAIEGAENFAKCGVYLLEHSKIVDNIAFGSESGNIDNLKNISKFMLEKDQVVSDKLLKYLKVGYAYPKAFDFVLKDFGFTEELSANNTLGIQYLKTLLELGSKITPYTIKREGSNYHSTDLNCDYRGASASAIRESIFTNNFNENIERYLPKNIHDDFILKTNENYTSLDNLSDILHYKLSTMQHFELENINQISEGIENRILKASNKFYKISDIINQCTTKRYTKSRLQRAILSIILGINKNSMQEYKSNNLAQYIRVLGYNKNKEYLLKDLVKKSTLPVVVNVNNAFLPPLASKMLEEEKKFSKIYNLSFNTPKLSKYDEIKSQPIIYNK
ncbi:MAG: nucleotidyltransferase [Lachnospirales bacterium]